MSRLRKSHSFRTVPEWSGSSLAGGPVEEGDEQNLHGGAEPEWGGGLATKGDVFVGGVEVGDEHGDEEKDEADAGEGAEAREEQAGGAEEFEDAGDVDEENRLREEGRDHAGEVVAHFVEMGAGGEEEHDGQGVAGRSVPGGERCDPQGANGAQDEPGGQEND